MDENSSVMLEERPAEETVSESVEEAVAEEAVIESAEPTSEAAEPAAQAEEPDLSLSNMGSSALQARSNLAAAIFSGLKAAGNAAAVSVAKHVNLIFPALVRFLSYLGHSAWSVLSRITAVVFGAVFSVLAALFGAVFGWLTKKFKQPLYDIWCFILTPFAHAYGGAASAVIRLKKAKKRGVIYAVGSAADSFWRFLCSVGEVLRFSFNYAAPVISIVFLVSLISYSSTLQYAISVEYNGSELGTIDSEATYNEATSLIKDKVNFTEDDDSIISTPKFYVTVINMDKTGEQPIDDIDQLSEMIIQGGDIKVVYAYCLYINDEPVGIYTEEDMELIRAALDDRLNLYNTPDTVDVRFEDDILISEGRFVETSLSTADEALDMINGSTTVEAYYVVKSGDSISKICDALDITKEEFEADNPSLSDGVKSGDIVTYHYLEPNLAVLTTHYENYGRVIEKVIQYQETSQLEEYCERLVQFGSDGYENVTALVVETNGVETERNIVSRTVVQEMVPRIFKVGTKQNTYLKSMPDVIKTLGTFVWPLADHDGYISSNFGYRSWDKTNHGGIDIAGIPRGTNIYAACDGTVTFSGWASDFGKLVIINHGHGYETYYAHCSELRVQVGDKVEKGQVIAEVGATGNASGYHLHFEVRLNDVRQDPFIALGGKGGHSTRF